MIPPLSMSFGGVLFVLFRYFDSLRRLEYKILSLLLEIINVIILL